ncbi:MAG: MFS transporter [Gaiellaceae bacterium]
MRRLLVVASAVVLVDSILYAALTPLLPRYVDEYDLTKGGAGLLVGAYAAGALVGGLPGGLAAARLGARTAAVAGLMTVAAASVVFGVAGDPWLLGAARFVQGLGSALSWSGALTWLVTAAPRERRAEMIGTALGVAIAGAMLGPVLGAVAEVSGEAMAFGGVALAATLLAGIALRVPGTPPERADVRALGRALTGRRLLAGFWLVTLPALLFGLLAVLAPLELSALGWSAVAIGALWLVTAGIESAMNPFLGRLVDRRGRLLPVQGALVASPAVLLGLAWAGSEPLYAALVVASGVAFGAMFTPGMALLSDAAERAGVAQALAFGATNAAWAVGNLVGPAGGGALASVAGDESAYAAAAGLAVLTLAGVWRHALTAGTRASSAAG